MLNTDVRARVLVLHVEGDVIELDGSSAGPGVEVTLTIVMNGTSKEAQVVTDAAGVYYRHLFACHCSPGVSSGTYRRYIEGASFTCSYRILRV